MFQHIFALSYLHMGIEQEIKSRFRNEYQKARINITVTAKYLSDKYVVWMNAMNITSSQYNILRILRGQEKKRLCIHEIKSRMIDKSSDVSRVVDKLVAKDLVERTENPEDRRLKDISITQKGLDLLSSSDPSEIEMDQHVSMLSEQEVKTLNILLDKIRHKTNK
jgi:DNA-binding MarR family transcriptional regulator